MPLRQMNPSLKPHLSLRYLIVPEFNPILLQKHEVKANIAKNLDVSNHNQTLHSRKIKLSVGATEPEVVFKCWIYMWCLTLSEWDEKEKYFRLNQLRQVIGHLKADCRVNLRNE